MSCPTAGPQRIGPELLCYCSDYNDACASRTLSRCRVPSCLASARPRPSLVSEVRCRRPVSVPPPAMVVRDGGTLMPRRTDARGQARDRKGRFLPRAATTRRGTVGAGGTSPPETSARTTKGVSDVAPTLGLQGSASAAERPTPPTAADAPDTPAPAATAGHPAPAPQVVASNSGVGLATLATDTTTRMGCILITPVRCAYAAVKRNCRTKHCHMGLFHSAISCRLASSQVRPHH